MSGVSDTYCDTYLGKMPRVLLGAAEGSFPTSTVDVINLADVDADFIGFSNVVTDGEYGYLLPHQKGKVVKFNVVPHTPQRGFGT